MKILKFLMSHFLERGGRIFSTQQIKGVWRDVLISKYDGWWGLWKKENGAMESMWWRDLKLVCWGH